MKLHSTKRKKNNNNNNKYILIYVFKILLEIMTKYTKIEGYGLGGFHPKQIFFQFYVWIIQEQLVDF